MRTSGDRFIGNCFYSSTILVDVDVLPKLLLFVLLMMLLWLSTFTTLFPPTPAGTATPRVSDGTASVIGAKTTAAGAAAASPTPSSAGAAGDDAVGTD